MCYWHLFIFSPVLLLPLTELLLRRPCICSGASAASAVSTWSLAISWPSCSSTQFWSSSSRLSPPCTRTHAHTRACMHTPAASLGGSASCQSRLLGGGGGAISAAARCPPEGSCYPCKHGTFAFPETRGPELNDKFQSSLRRSSARCVRCAADLQAAEVKPDELCRASCAAWWLWKRRPSSTAAFSFLLSLKAIQSTLCCVQDITRRVEWRN